MHDSYLPEDMPVSSGLSFPDLIQGVWLCAYGFGHSALAYAFGHSSEVQAITYLKLADSWLSWAITMVYQKLWF